VKTKAGKMGWTKRPKAPAGPEGPWRAERKSLLLPDVLGHSPAPRDGKPERIYF